MLYLQAFRQALLHALKNLFPIVAVVVFFQLVVLQGVTENSLRMAIGLFVIAIDVALFL